MGPSVSRPVEVSKVLVIDDDPASGRALEAILVKEGFRVVRGNDGPGGVGAVSELTHLPAKTDPPATRN
jgi:PleD family two-component response regulator